MQHTVEYISSAIPLFTPKFVHKIVKDPPNYCNGPPTYVNYYGNTMAKIYQ